MDPLIKSQLLYQLSYAPFASLRAGRILYQRGAVLSSKCRWLSQARMLPGVGPMPVMLLLTGDRRPRTSSRGAQVNLRSTAASPD